MKMVIGGFVVSIEFSPLSTVELTTNWYQLHNGDYKGILEHSFGKQLPTNFLQSLLEIYKLICPVRILKLVCPVRTDKGRNVDVTQSWVLFPTP